MTAKGAAPARKPADLAVRSVTGLMLIAVALVCVVLGGRPFWLLLSAAGLLILAEWAAMVGAQRWQLWVASIGLAAILLVTYPSMDVSDYAAPATLLAAAVLVLLVTRAPRLAAGTLYAGAPLVALCYLQRQFDGIGLTLWTIAIVVATDVGAYFAGRRFGGPKLAPVVSPNKTWAGLIGGVVCADVAGVALAHLLGVPMALAALAGLLAIAAQGGDLYESAMKRRAGVKDSGRVLPGHGGVMDRVDGLIPVVCVVALVVASGLV